MTKIEGLRDGKPWIPAQGRDDNNAAVQDNKTAGDRGSQN
jgi:hypothetical protein